MVSVINIARFKVIIKYSILIQQYRGEGNGQYCDLK